MLWRKRLFEGMGKNMVCRETEISCICKVSQGGMGVPGLAPISLPDELPRQVAPCLAPPVASSFGVRVAKCGIATWFSSPAGGHLSKSQEYSQETSWGVWL